MNEKKAKLQTDFYTFYRFMFGLDKASNWWVKEICQYLQDLYYDYRRELRPIYCIEAPVQHGKTTYLRYYLAWLIGRHPDKRFNYYSADDKLKDETSLYVNMVLADDRYKAIFGERNVNIRPNNEQIMLSGGGKVQFRITGGGSVGYPSHFSIIDDPYAKKEDALSATWREKIWSRFTADIISRRQSDSMILVTHSRWHVDDMIGRLKDKRDDFKSPVKFLSYPAIAVSDEKYRKAGEPLLPQLRDIKFLDEQRSIMSESEFMALYQQNPIIEGGNLFKIDWFGFIPQSSIPEVWDFTFIVSDTAYKAKQQNDYTVFMYFGVRDKKLYLIDMIRRQISAIDIERWAEAWFTDKIKKNNFRYIWIENKGHGIYLNQSFRNKGISVPTEQQLKETMDTHLDKVMRANNSIARIDKVNYNVFINSDLEQIDDFKMEVVSFPNGVHDDMVDCLSYGIKIGLGQKDYVSEMQALLYGVN